MVSPEKGLPSSFDIDSGLNVKWIAELGTESYSTPVVAAEYLWDRNLLTK